MRTEREGGGPASPMSAYAGGLQLEALVHDRPGVLARIADVFYRRGFNLRQMSVEPSSRRGFSSMRVVVEGVESERHRVVLALDNLIDVVAVRASSGIGENEHESHLRRGQ